MNTYYSKDFKPAVSKTSNQADAYMYNKHMHKINRNSNFPALTVATERTYHLSFTNFAPWTTFASNLIITKACASITNQL